MLQGAKEAEKMIVEAYSALLLAFLSTERSVCCHKPPYLSIPSYVSLINYYLLGYSKSIRRAIAECLPNQKLSVVVPVLERFVVCILHLVLVWKLAPFIKSTIVPPLFL